MAHQVLPPDRWPLFEIRASRHESRVRLHISLDLLIMDAFSFELFFRDWRACYENPDHVPPPLAISYRDHVLAERAEREGPRYRAAETYWLSRVDALPPAPELPLLRQPAQLDRTEFTRRRAALPADRWRAIKQRARERGVTPSAVLLAAFADVLRLWSKQPDFTVNVTLFNRRRPTRTSRRSSATSPRSLCWRCRTRPTCRSPIGPRPCRTSSCGIWSTCRSAASGCCGSDCGVTARVRAPRCLWSSPVRSGSTASRTRRTTWPGSVPTPTASARPPGLVGPPGDRGGGATRLQLGRGGGALPRACSTTCSPSTRRCWSGWPDRAASGRTPTSRPRHPTRTSSSGAWPTRRAFRSPTGPWSTSSWRGPSRTRSGVPSSRTTAASPTAPCSGGRRSWRGDWWRWTPPGTNRSRWSCPGTPTRSARSSAWSPPARPICRWTRSGPRPAGTSW
ncbi:condensation domain-containing protein [Micromonospora sp. M12]